MRHLGFFSWDRAALFSFIFQQMVIFQALIPSRDLAPTTAVILLLPLYFSFSPNYFLMWENLSLIHDINMASVLG